MKIIIGFAGSALYFVSAISLEILKSLNVSLLISHEAPASVMFPPISLIVIDTTKVSLMLSANNLKEDACANEPNVASAFHVPLVKPLPEAGVKVNDVLPAPSIGYSLILISMLFFR